MNGYSQRIIRKNEEASVESWGVKLGRACIAKSVSVYVVASMFGVSRTTVYAWFIGIKQPYKKRVPEIQEFINNLEV